MDVNGGGLAVGHWLFAVGAERKEGVTENGDLLWLVYSWADWLYSPIAPPEKRDAFPLFCKFTAVVIFINFASDPL